MTNLTAIGLYANGMPFCVTVETDDYELVKKVMNKLILYVKHINRPN